MDARRQYGEVAAVGQVGTLMRCSLSSIDSDGVPAQESVTSSHSVWCTFHQIHKGL